MAVNGLFYTVRAVYVLCNICTLGQLIDSLAKMFGNNVDIWFSLISLVLNMYLKCMLKIETL